MSAVDAGAQVRPARTADFIAAYNAVERVFPAAFSAAHFFTPRFFCILLDHLGKIHWHFKSAVP
jgi:hypothetical protein